MLIQRNMYLKVVASLKEKIGFEDMPKAEQDKILPKIEAATREAIRNHGK